MMLTAGILTTTIFEYHDYYSYYCCFYFDYSAANRLGHASGWHDRDGQVCPHLRSAPVGKGARRSWLRQFVHQEPKRAYVYEYACEYVCSNLCVYIYVYIYLPMYSYIYMFTHTYTHTYTYTYMVFFLGE